MNLPAGKPADLAAVICTHGSVDQIAGSVPVPVIQIAGMVKCRAVRLHVKRHTGIRRAQSLNIQVIDPAFFIRPHIVNPLRHLRRKSMFYQKVRTHLAVF